MGKGKMRLAKKVHNVREGANDCPSINLKTIAGKKLRRRDLKFFTHKIAVAADGEHCIMQSTKDTEDFLMIETKYLVKRYPEGHVPDDEVASGPPFETTL